MKFSTKLAIGFIVVVIIVLWFSFHNSNSSDYDSFAQCLTSKGMKLYGAYWCSHCQDQKDMFGSSIKYVDYVECSLPNAAGQTQICISEGIESYPTWQMPDGNNRQGILTLQELSALSGCPLA